MFASFHSEGTIPSSDKLNNFASGVLICSTISLSSFGGIPSTPGDGIPPNMYHAYMSLMCSSNKHVLPTVSEQ